MKSILHFRSNGQIFFIEVTANCVKDRDIGVGLSLKFKRLSSPFPSMKNKRLDFLKSTESHVLIVQCPCLSLTSKKLSSPFPSMKKNNWIFKKTIKFCVLKSTMSWFILADGVSVVFGLDHSSHCSLLSFLVLFSKEILGSSYADPLFKVTLIILM